MARYRSHKVSAFGDIGVESYDRIGDHGGKRHENIYHVYVHIPLLAGKPLGNS